MRILGFQPSKTLLYGSLGVVVAMLTAWLAARPDLDPQHLAVLGAILAGLRFLQATAQRDAVVRTNEQVVRSVEDSQMETRDAKHAIVAAVRSNGHSQQQQQGWTPPTAEPYCPPLPEGSE